MMHLKTAYIFLFGVLTLIHGISSQQNVDPRSGVSENSQELQKHPAPPSAINRPARQQRPSQAGFGGLLSGSAFYTVMRLCFCQIFSNPSNDEKAFVSNILACRLNMIRRVFFLKDA